MKCTRKLYRQWKSSTSTTEGLIRTKRESSVGWAVLGTGLAAASGVLIAIPALIDLGSDTVVLLVRGAVMLRQWSMGFVFVDFTTTIHKAAASNNDKDTNAIQKGIDRFMGAMRYILVPLIVNSGRIAWTTKIVPHSNGT